MRQISPTEVQLLEAERDYFEAWIRWCEEACRAGVRLDVEPESLREVTRYVEIAPGVVVTPGGRKWE